MNPLVILNMLVSPITTLIGNWQEKKKIEAEGVIAETRALSDAKIRHLETTTTADIDWNMLAMQNSAKSWKDEYILILLSIPMILCFIPGMAPFVTAGFVAISATPLWFQSAFGVAVAASFGYKMYADHQYKMT